jgi:hypothetical protein
VNSISYHDLFAALVFLVLSGLFTLEVFVGSVDRRRVRRQHKRNGSYLSRDRLDDVPGKGHEAIELNIDRHSNR